ncbi:DMT family transporter [Pseudomonas citronellolis]|uniref:DMT family transporter n=1 Tax=Pseudomonas citronellolis TaxID=53408 RepID=UPI0023E3D63C|nr:DMT family transporter [Pseudomonas citronellolis]MDF3935818.1 DMT family transporter [Pseudomonas citronellolis]
MQPRDLSAYMFLALVWGLSFLALLKAVAGFGWVGAVSFRALIASATLLVVARLSGRALNFRGLWKPLCVVGATTVAGQLVGMTFATPLIGTAMAAIFVAAIPLFSMLIGRIWGLERLALSGVAGLLLGLVGMLLLVGFPAVPVTPSFVLGCAGSIFGALCAAYGSNYAALHLRTAGSWEVTCGAFLVGGVLTLPLLYWVPPPGLPSLTDVFYLLLCGCVMSAVNYVLYFRLVSRIGATKAISVEFVVTVVAVLAGTLVLHEPLSLVQGLGALIILLGCALVLGLLPGVGRRAVA